MPARQLSLFSAQAPGFDASFAELRRTHLAHDAWVDYAPAWLSGHEQVLETLIANTRWRSEQRVMYERTVEVPRLYGLIPDDGPGHPVLFDIQRALSRHYATEFARISLGYYRNGKDSVAWHGDYVARRMQEALVATVSVGAPRRFALRPAGGGASIPYSLGWGDLIVMGGTCQRTWQHCVPKIAHADPRIAIMFRPIWEEPAGPRQY